MHDHDHTILSSFSSDPTKLRDLVEKKTDTVLLTKREYGSVLSYSISLVAYGHALPNHTVHKEPLYKVSRSHFNPSLLLNSDMRFLHVRYTRKALVFWAFSMIKGINTIENIAVHKNKHK